MTVFVNDQPRALAAGAKLADLLRELGLAERKGVAIAINDEVAPRSTWFDQISAATREAPVQSLVVAFLIGVLLARR